MGVKCEICWLQMFILYKELFKRYYKNNLYYPAVMVQYIKI